MLKPWDERPAKEQSASAVAGQLMSYGTSQIRDASVLGFTPPAIVGLSTTGGFELYVQSRANADYRAIAGVVQDFIAQANKDPAVGGVRTLFSASAPQIELNIDRDKAAQMGVSLTQLFEATQATFGSLYVNDFNRDARTYQVRLQAEGSARDEIEDLRNVSVRADTGELVPLNTLVSVEHRIGPEQVERFNAFPAIKVLGDPAPGASSGDAIAAIERVAAETLPAGYSVAWIGSAFQEKQVSSSAAATMLGGLLFVFLILAAQYERWSLPFAVMLSMPFALLGATLAVLLRGLANDIYFQIGLVTLIGLSAKNAILIVAFAAENVRSGMTVVDAALLAAKQRFRPIVMTSLAFILGVLPLAISAGAGASARHSIGTGVMGGMLASTAIATLFIPSLFRWVSRRDERRERSAAPSATFAAAGMSMKSGPIAFVLALSLTACAGIPERNVPDDVALPGRFTAVSPTGDAEIPVEWWKAFNDPQLERLVERGLVYNSDLIIGAQRLREARAAFRSVRANQLPDIGVFIDGARERTPLVDPSDQSFVDTSIVETSSYGVSVGYEVDLWGRLASQTEAERQRYLAQGYGAGRTASDDRRRARARLSAGPGVDRQSRRARRERAGARGPAASEPASLRARRDLRARPAALPFRARGLARTARGNHAAAAGDRTSIAGARG